MKIIKKFYSSDGTIKYLLQLEDDAVIESVFYPFSRIASLIAKLIFFGGYFKIPYSLYNYSPMKFLYKHTNYYGICVSSQIGCQLGCKFCATGKQKFQRNLTDKEIIDQVIVVINDYQPKNIQKLELVFAGMGEPLLNYRNVTKAIKNAPDALKKYKINEIYPSIMTVDIISALKSLIKDNIKINLFLSLHSTKDTIRSNIMPIGTSFKIDDILEVASHYQRHSNTRPVRINYILIKDLNDSLDNAEKLATYAKKYNFIVQVKMFNTVSGCNYQRVPLERLKRFLKTLKDNDAKYVFDISKGISNNAGCGQLRYYDKQFAISKCSVFS